MPVGMIGKKLGMTRVFTETGVSLPVTVVHAPVNRVVQVKTPDTDGYFALQLTAGTAKPSKLSKAVAKHYAKVEVDCGRVLREFCIAEEEQRKVGDEIRVTVFGVGESVDVVGISKGKGTAGTVKRHNFRMQDATHGNSVSHRALGSTGQCQLPGRVLKGKKMAGRMGFARVTVKNLKVVNVDENRELLLIRGAIPGSCGSEVLIHHRKLVPSAEELKDAPGERQVKETTEATMTDTESGTIAAGQQAGVSADDNMSVKQSKADAPDIPSPTIAKTTDASASKEEKE